MVARTALVVLIVDLDLGGRMRLMVFKAFLQTQVEGSDAVSGREREGVRPLYSLVSAAEVGGERPWAGSLPKFLKGMGGRQAPSGWEA